MEDRNKDMSMLFGDQPPTEVVLGRLKGLKGVKIYYYTLMLIIENEAINKEEYREEFELTMTMWINDKVSSTQLEKRAMIIIEKEINIVDDPTLFTPVEIIK